VRTRTNPPPRNERGKAVQWEPTTDFGPEIIAGNGVVNNSYIQDALQEEQVMALTTSLLSVVIGDVSYIPEIQ
jgi:hypothetical protein